jgi:hypothetical protein
MDLQVMLSSSHQQEEEGDRRHQQQGEELLLANLAFSLSANVAAVNVAIPIISVAVCDVLYVT